MLRDLLDVVLPTACAGCQGHMVTGESGRLCELCQTRLPRSLWPLGVDGLDEVWAWAPYEGPVGAAMRRGKYRPDPSTLKELGARLALAASGVVASVDLVVPVPRSWQALAWTGFEPAGLLGAPLAAHARRPLVRCLRRRPGLSQAALPELEREANVAGAFWTVTPLSGSRVLLIDDVITTGSTARACVKALRAGGASDVVVLAACSPLM